MSPLPHGSWERVEALFHQAVELPAEKRDVFLDQACGGDGALRREVTSLLASTDQNLDFVERPLSEAAGLVAEAHVGPGSRLGLGTLTFPPNCLSLRPLHDWLS